MFIFYRNLLKWRLKVKDIFKNEKNSEAEVKTENDEAEAVSNKEEGDDDEENEKNDEEDIDQEIEKTIDNEKKIEKK